LANFPLPLKQRFMVTVWGVSEVAVVSSVVVTNAPSARPGGGPS
jgi:hypothetical protein